MTIDTAMHIEPPRLELLVAVKVPECIGSADTVHTALNNPVPTEKTLIPIPNSHEIYLPNNHPNCVDPPENFLHACHRNMYILRFQMSLIRKIRNAMGSMGSYIDPHRLS